MLASHGDVLSFPLTRNLQGSASSCAFLYSGSFFEGRDKTKPIKGDEEIAWSGAQRAWDNASSEGQSEPAEKLPVLQNKVI